VIQKSEATAPGFVVYWAGANWNAPIEVEFISVALAGHTNLPLTAGRAARRTGLPGTKNRVS
jgi:hypothetical protein